MKRTSKVLTGLALIALLTLIVKSVRILIKIPCS